MTIPAPSLPADLRIRRRLPIGAEAQPGGGTHFRVWAPASTSVSVVVDRQAAVPWPQIIRALSRDEHGYFEGFVPEAHTGTLYRYRLDDGQDYPDPASRFQPDGPHGRSQVIDPAEFAWTDTGWSGVSRTGLVVYEMHIGTFTREGTWAAACRELPALAELGVTVLEIMPVAEFPGSFGWGYDGVDLFAPTRLYGEPRDLRTFVDTAHRLGLGVVLDVVYNHFGPDGCYVDKFAPAYFSPHGNEWGRSLNFDGPDCGPVREFFIANAGYWIDEYHLDGLRLDATQAIVDHSPTNILKEVADAVRRAAGPRGTWIVCENEPQDTDLVRSPEEGGCGLDALWNDDYHHSAMVALTGRREAYYTDYFGTPQEFVSEAKHGFLYQGQWYSWQEQGRGTPTHGVPPEAFVTFLQNHDQVANSWSGARIDKLASPGRVRALTAALLLGPSTPMLLQGQEFAASTPFLYFADHAAPLSGQVRKGRSEFMAQFSSVAHAEAEQALPDPAAPETFDRCKLDHSEREAHRATVALHASLLQLRSSEDVFRAHGRCGFDGAVLSPHAFVYRYFNRTPCGPDAEDRLIVVNLGVQLELPILPEPLLAPPRGHHWSVVWSSEDPLYGGGGTLDVIVAGAWRLPAESAMVFAPVANRVR